MKFRTEISIPASPAKIEHGEKIITIGSCFAENMGEKFGYYYFNVLSNPFGVLYNPVSIYNALDLALSGREFGEKDLFYDKNEWHSFFHHSEFSNYDLNECLLRINNRSKEVNNFIKEAGWIILTLGTSFVYRHIERGIIVSNCHRIPADRFAKILLSPAESENYLDKTISLLRNANNKLNIILTVSPVRHIKDGFAENQLSKSSLAIAVHNSIKKNDNVFYFPSYEIVMDDLRDYRFYADDMLHPSDSAVRYIWDIFAQSFMTDETLKLKMQMEQLSADLAHRPLHPMSGEYKLFLHHLEKRRENIIRQYPFLAERLQK